jgi:hypothetical protein
MSMIACAALLPLKDSRTCYGDYLRLALKLSSFTYLLAVADSELITYASLPTTIYMTLL